jgi:aminopeptidase
LRTGFIQIIIQEGVVLTKTHIKKYAEVLLWGLKTARTASFKKGDIVLVRFDLAALKLAESLQAKLLDIGMNPILRLVSTPLMEHHLFKKANSRQLVFLPPGEEDLTRNLNGGIYLHAPASLTHLKDIDPKKIGKVALSRKPLRDILNKREAEGQYGWTLCTLPTEEQAHQAHLSVKQYTNQIIRACYLDDPNPVKAWKTIHNDAMSIKKWLNGMRIKRCHVESKNIDLKITPGEQRQWVGISGHNIPSFEIFISPDWRETQGTYFADQPSFRSGNYVEGVQLSFLKGTAVKITSKKGQLFVIKQMSMDKGASRLGEFSLTDKRFSRINKFMANTLFDENFGGRHGNCHIAVGASYSDAYDGNPAELTKDMKKKLGFNDSALHWDLVNTEDKTVTAHLANGHKQVIYEAGMFNY